MKKDDSVKLIDVFNELGISWTHSGFGGDVNYVEPGDVHPKESEMVISTLGWEFIFNNKGEFLGVVDSRDGSNITFH